MPLFQLNIRPIQQQSNVVMPLSTRNDPGVLRPVHAFLVRFAEYHDGFVLVEVADDDPNAVLLRVNTDGQHNIAVGINK